MQTMSAILVYDGECFFCSNYVRLLRLRESVGGIELVNARERDKVIVLGLNPRDLNEGMVLILDGKHYAGAEAINRLALLSTSSRWFNRVNNRIFKSAALSRLLYPWLRAGRRCYLMLVGKRLID